MISFWFFKFLFLSPLFFSIFFFIHKKQHKKLKFSFFSFFFVSSFLFPHSLNCLYHFFFVSSSMYWLYSWKLPYYWRTNARLGQLERDASNSRELHRLHVLIEKERASLPTSVDKNVAEEKWKNLIATCQLKNKQYNRYKEEIIKSERETYYSESVHVLECDVRHDLLNIVEYAPSVDVETPVMYIGFNHIEKDDEGCILYEHSNKYATPSAASDRYLIEFVSYEICIEWERALRPWMNELRKGSKW